MCAGKPYLIFVLNSLSWHNTVLLLHSRSFIDFSYPLFCLPGKWYCTASASWGSRVYRNLQYRQFCCCSKNRTLRSPSLQYVHGGLVLILDFHQTPYSHCLICDRWSPLMNQPHHSTWYVAGNDFPWEKRFTVCQLTGQAIANLCIAYVEVPLWIQWS